MPINLEKNKRVYVTLTNEEHGQLLTLVNQEKKGGRKMSPSRYIAELVREHLIAVDFFAGCNGETS
jgi:hypothetical protein